ncbi:hypothetical protein BM1374166_02132 [Bartonella tribocorum]|nr:hypothetical protein BM1374166_02132 [Bartonella tribocorum]
MMLFIFMRKFHFKEAIYSGLKKVLIIILLLCRKNTVVWGVVMGRDLKFYTFGITWVVNSQVLFVEFLCQ